jgi:TolB-like protein
MSQGNPVISRTLADLRRRKVVRVAATYGVVAWLAVEVSSVVIPALHLPEWVISAVVITAMAGFPITLLLAWVFDLTPQGVIRTRPAAEGADEVHRVARRGIDFVVIAVLLAIIGYLVAQQGYLGPVGQADRSIAVLPFIDLSETGDNEYFSDGISEELLNSLVGVDGLRVAARTSSFAFKGRNEDVRVIGQKLNVRTVLEGSVRRSGDQVRITAQLINVEDGFHLWSETYNRQLDDIFAIQDEISRSIVDALKLELIGAEALLPGAGPTADIMAYDLYLLGRHHWHERTGDSLRRALELFQQAVEADPDFALAYTGIADTYLLLDGYGDLTRQDAIARAEPSVARALALDDSLAEAYASLGLLRLNQHDLTSAELALRSAVNLNPNYSMAHMWLGLVLDKTEGPAAAREAYLQASQLDPLHPVINRNLAISSGSTGRLRDAQQVLGEMIESDSSDPLNYFILSEVLRDYGRLDESARWAWRGSDPDPEGLNAMSLAQTMTALGEFERADRFLTTAEQRMPRIKGTLGARFSLTLAKGDLEAMGRLAESVSEDAPVVGESDEKSAMDVWRGLAAIVSGAPDRGAIQLRAGLENSASGFLLPADRLGLMAALAYGERLAGQAATADGTIATTLRLAERSKREGRARPQIDAWEAVLLSMQGDQDGARAAFTRAVEGGWRDYFVVRNFPPAQELFSDPEIDLLIDRVRVDIGVMADSVRGLEDRPHPAAQSKIAQLNRQT